MSQLSLTLFGALQVRLDGETVKDFGSNKVRALLAYLAVESNRPHSRDVLAGLLWPDWSDREARNNLRYALSDLRGAIADRQASPHFLTISREMIQFNRDSAYRLDTEEFEGCLAEGAAQSQDDGQLARAVSLYQGEFLEGFSIYACAAFDEWRTLKSEVYRRQLVDALQRLAAICEKNGDYEGALVYARQLAALEPYQEAGQRQIIKLLAELGEHGAAIVQYQSFQDLLQTELGTTPSEQTRQLYESIASGEWQTESAPSPLAAPTPPVGECPYRGLAAFKETDARFFYGRRHSIEQIWQALERSAPLTTLISASGSGKTSLLFAGLLPRLRGQPDWLVANFRPGMDPFFSLASALTPLLEPDAGESGRLIAGQRLASALASGELHLAELLERIFQIHPVAEKLVLILDQFEELYTLCPQTERQRAFLDELLRTIDRFSNPEGSQVLLLLAMRADFMGQALAYRPFADVLQDACQMLGPMTRSELRDVIVIPAQAQHAGFEPGLVERILDDVGEQPGRLPLLEFSLTLIWENLTAGQLTHAAYEGIGQVDGALARYADQVYLKLDESQREAARRLFLQLVQPGIGTEDTRRIAARRELNPQSWRLARHLADQRLVVTSRDAEGEGTVEVVHEALLLRWEKLRTWIEEDRAFRTWQERTRTTAQQWLASGKDEGALLRGLPLSQAESWASARADEISALETAYIEACLALRDRMAREKEAQRQRELQSAQKLAASEGRARRFLLGIALSLTAAVLVAIVMVGFSLRQQRAAMQAYSLSLAANARQSINDKDSAAGLVLAQAANQIKNAPQEAQRTLLEAAYMPGARRRISIMEIAPGTTGAPLSMALDPNGERVLTGLSNGDLILWDLESGKLLEQFVGHRGPVNSVVFSPDGEYALSASDDGMAIYWDLNQRSMVYQLSAHSGAVKTGAISADGRTAATGGLSGDSFILPGELILWDLESGREIERFEGHANGVVQVDFSPDGGKLLASSGEPQYLEQASDVTYQMLVWDLESGQIAARFEDSQQDITDFAINLDGSSALLGGRDHNFYQWNYNSDQESRILEEHTATITAVAYSPVDQRSIYGDENGGLYVWDLQGEELIARFDIHTEMINEVVFLPDGRQALSSSSDGTFILWDLYDASEMRRFYGHTAPILDVAFLSNGKQFLTSSGSADPGYIVEDNTIRLWDLASGRQIRKMKVPTVGGAFQIAPSADGAMALSAQSAGEVWLWDLKTGTDQRHLLSSPVPTFNIAYCFDERVALAGLANGSLVSLEIESGEILQRMSGHNGGIWAVAVSPQGERAFSGADDSIFILWDLASGEEIRRFPAQMGGASGAAFHPNGTTAIAGYPNGMLIYWDLESGQEIFRIDAHGDYQKDGRTRVEILPDGSMALSSGWEGSLALWDLDTGRLIRRFWGHDSGFIMDISVSPDGRTALSGGGDGVVIQWDLVIPSAERLSNWIAENRYVRTLSCEERETYQIEPLCKQP